MSVGCRPKIRIPLRRFRSSTAAVLTADIPTASCDPWLAAAAEVEVAVLDAAAVCAEPEVVAVAKSLILKRLLYLIF